jgi:hypothetical protein
VGIENYDSTAVLSDTQWHYVAVALSGNQLDFYFDGSTAGSVPIPGPFVTGGPFAVGGLGALVNNSRYSLLGSMDELAVYSRALSSSELWRAVAASSNWAEAARNRSAAWAAPVG